MTISYSYSYDEHNTYVEYDTTQAEYWLNEVDEDEPQSPYFSYDCGLNAPKTEKEGGCIYEGTQHCEDCPYA